MRHQVVSQPNELTRIPLGAEHAPTPYIEHWVVQLHGVQPCRLDDSDVLTNTLSRLVVELGLTEVSNHAHFFGPGVSAVIILSESHLSAHTWPESGYAHVDIVTCVERLTAESLERGFNAAFSPGRIDLARLDY